MTRGICCGLASSGGASLQRHAQHMPCQACAPVIPVLVLELQLLVCHYNYAGSSLHRFGENLDPKLLNKAQQAVEDADLFITVGTSSCVYPAAGFVAQVLACWLLAPVTVSSPNRLSCQPMPCGQHAEVRCAAWACWQGSAVKGNEGQSSGWCCRHQLEECPVQRST